MAIKTYKAKLLENRDVAASRKNRLKRHAGPGSDGVDRLQLTAGGPNIPNVNGAGESDSEHRSPSALVSCPPSCVDSAERYLTTHSPLVAPPLFYQDDHYCYLYH